MTQKTTAKTRYERLRYSFPLQLFFVHLQRSFFLLVFWIILFGFVTQGFANKLGIPYLFLGPEYKGEVGVWSYAILGFSLGGFIMAYNVHSYVSHAHLFPFLGSLSRPFYKFCVNNSAIPLLFVGTYLVSAYAFLRDSELKSHSEIFIDLSAFLLGNVLFIVIAFLYFIPTNKNIFKITGLSEEEFELRIKKRIRGLRKSGNKAPRTAASEDAWRVTTYLTNPVKAALARDTSHYDKETLEKVFSQNHVNASIFEIIIIAVFVFIGAFQFNSNFVIPSAASACLVFTAIIMIVSILMSWLKNWTFPVLVILLVALNTASAKYDILNMANPAYGIDYSKPPVAYNNATIDSLNSDLMRVRQDVAYQENILNRWLNAERKRKGDPSYKPKMVFVNTSGGGQRSTLFTVQCLQQCDSITEGAFFRNTRMMTGSSGGTVGAAYFRELYLRKDSLQRSINSSHYTDNAAKDILNRIMFTLATNDVFVRFRHREIAGHRYVLDRAMTFEHQLNINTEFVLDKAVSDYADPVYRGDIPMMVLAPSVVNDGRRFLISSQPISYLCYEYPDVREDLNLAFENIEFNRMFAGHGADQLLITSALRMNSTFPYILPYAALPTSPTVEVMDAGLRDNFGTKITAQYIFAFRQWIEKNTSGIVVLQIRDVEKHFEPTGNDPTIFDKLMNPIGSFYGNYFNDQDYNMDQLMRMTSNSIKVPIYQIPLEIVRYPDENIALSWHLTALEKQRVLQSIDFPGNQQSLARLKELLSD